MKSYTPGEIYNLLVGHNFLETLLGCPKVSNYANHQRNSNFQGLMKSPSLVKS